MINEINVKKHSSDTFLGNSSEKLIDSNIILNRLESLSESRRCCIAPINIALSYRLQG